MANMGQLIRKIAGIATVLRRTTSILNTEPDRFLKRVSGVVHVGANSGQERTLYEQFGLRVIWIEPIPEVFEMLKANLQGHPRQAAFQYLVTDQDDVEYVFHIANNAGASSSIFELNLHKDIWPEVAYDRTITLRSRTLAYVLKKERVNLADYDALIMDTQGSELLVLRGAAPILHGFKFIKTEVPDFESYAGCCKLEDIDAFVKGYGFQEISRRKFAEHAKGGSYYDIVYEKQNA